MTLGWVRSDMVMNGIQRNKGGNDSERFLAEIAERSFLNLWTYPSLFRQQKIRGNGDGKELCDLLVVCGDDVIVFSDKEVAWPQVEDQTLAWNRWFKKGITKSAEQAYGAAGWLEKHPERVFLDNRCTRQLPVDMPPAETRRIHLVVIATGAEAATIAKTGHPFGLLMIDSRIKGAGHHVSKADANAAFRIGDIDPMRPFVHVFSRQGVHILLEMLDTITDFADYLTRRAEVIRSRRLLTAFGEDDLVSQYMMHMNDDGEHDFSTSQHDPLIPIAVPLGISQRYIQHPAFDRKRDADQISYNWDRLITQFTDTLMSGAAIGFDSNPPVSAQVEVPLRAMAREPSLSRRLLGLGIVGAYEQITLSKALRQVRIMLPGPDEKRQLNGYVFLILTMSEDIYKEYDRYRKYRMILMHYYAKRVLLAHPELEIIVAIGVDAPPSVTGLINGSEDLMHFRQPEWTPRLKEDILSACEKLEILVDYTGRDDAIERSTDEYPAHTG